MGRPVEFEQVQGIVRFGYGKLTECCFMLLAIRDAGAARGWLGGAPVTNAVALATAPQTALQIALTHEGLQRLGLPPEVLSQFSIEFCSGQASSARSRLLGDIGESAPDHWSWGAGESVPHVMLMLYARPGQLAAWQQSLRTPAWDAAFRVVAELPTAHLDGTEPFGFPDGISQPELDWERQRTPPATEDTYTQRIALGEFLLGYPNEYNRYTDRPLLPADAPFAEQLPAAEDRANLRDFGRNGCYLVLRTLVQDVEGFWQFVRENTGSDEGAQTLAETMVGRRKDGTPLVGAGTSPPDGSTAANQNNFRFDGDPNGTQCPFGAHIRRANPRNGDLPDPPVTGIKRWLALLGLGRKTLHSDSKASARFHRILRRGREFGPSEPGTQAADSAPPIEGAGIHFICLAGNISRQFEFLQNAWLMSTKFDGMTDESDPLLGSREPIPGAAPTDTFTIPAAGGPNRTLCSMPRFITVRGGGYFFLPSIPALQYLSKLH